MKGNRGSILVGALLVLAGIIFLLQNFGALGPLENVFWLVVFGAGGLAFVGVFLSDQQNWWAIIPGFTLLGLAALIGFGERLGVAGGALFLAAIGLSFWVIYAVRREFWWAVIPGGTLLTLAAVALLAERMKGEAVGGVFFLGLAATFVLVYLLPTPEGRMKWAIFPAAVMAVMGVLLIVLLGGWINILLSIALILGGAALLYWALVARR